jgi:mannobiose 2-epimerase
LTALLDVMLTCVVDPESFHFQCFFDADWRPASDEVSYGHDIEGSWLMVEAAEVLKEPEREQRSRELALAMVDAVWREGVDGDYGVMNEGRGVEIVDGSKHWWPQAEAVVGCVNAYQISHNPAYLVQAANVWSFIENHLLDKPNGEWLARVKRNGEPIPSNQADAWKCPYHNTRACIEVIQRLS